MTDPREPQHWRTNPKVQEAHEAFRDSMREYAQALANEVRGTGLAAISSAYKSLVNTRLDSLLAAVASVQAMTPDWKDVLQKIGGKLATNGLVWMPDGQDAKGDAMIGEDLFRTIVRESVAVSPAVSPTPTLLGAERVQAISKRAEEVFRPLLDKCFREVAKEPRGMMLHDIKLGRESLHRDICLVATNFAIGEAQSAAPAVPSRAAPSADTPLNEDALKSASAAARKKLNEFGGSFPDMIESTRADMAWQTARAAVKAYLRASVGGGEAPEPDFCGQCGQPYSASACGPTHAMIANERASSLPSAPAPQDTALARDVRRIVRQTGERILANDEGTAESDVSIAAEGFDEISRLQSFAQYLDLPSAPAPDPHGEPETCWLIERGQNEGQSPTVWWAGEGRGEWGPWTTDAREAVKFPTKESAQGVLDSSYAGAFLSRPASARVTQHVYLGAASLPSGSPPSPTATASTDTETAPQVNQCDGCARGLPVNNSGIHFQVHEGGAITLYMGCTKDRYLASPSPTDGDTKK